MEAELSGSLERLDAPTAPVQALLEVLTSDRGGCSRHTRLATEHADTEASGLKFEYIVLQEPANEEAINAVARLRASSRVYLTGKDGVTSGKSLRSTLYEYNERVFCGFAKVLYHDQALAMKLGKKMRRDSGIAHVGYNFEEDPDKVPGAAGFLELVNKGLSPRCATKSAFVGPKIFRRIVRAGLPIVEVDQCNAVLVAQLLRHPGAEKLKAYTEGRSQYLQTSPTCTIKQAKQLYTGLVNGGGKRHMEQWERPRGRRPPPSRTPSCRSSEASARQTKRQTRSS